MRIENLLIGLAVFVAVISLGVTMFIEQVENYDYSADTTIFTDILNVSEDYEDQQDMIEDGTIGGGMRVEDEGSDNLIVAAAGQIKDISGSVAVAGNTISTTTRETGLIPDFISQLFINIIVILAIAFALYMFVRFKPFN